MRCDINAHELCGCDGTGKTSKIYRVFIYFASPFIVLLNWPKCMSNVNKYFLTTKFFRSASNKKKIPKFWDVPRQTNFSQMKLIDLFRLRGILYWHPRCDVGVIRTEDTPTGSRFEFGGSLKGPVTWNMKRGRLQKE